MVKDLVKRMSHSSEQSIRDVAVAELQSTIEAGELDFSDIELRKLFQGIFYCFYHSDKPAYQHELADKFTGFLNKIESEEKKLLWHRHFFKMLSMHWDKLDNWRMNKYLMLIRKQIIVVFQHVQTIWAKNTKKLQKYMDAIYEESLKEVDVPMGIGLQMADVYIDEIANNFEKLDLTQVRVAALLSPFLQALGKIHQIALFQRIKEKVFLKLLDCNGINSDEQNPLYFPKFDIVDYSENQMFKVASSNDTIESRRDEIYTMYEKAAGREKPKAAELSYAERLSQLQKKHRKPKTKHQKKQLIRDKAQKAMNIKKRIMKLFQKKQMEMMQSENPDFGLDDNEVDVNDNPQTASLEALSQSIANQLNQKLLAQAAPEDTQPAQGTLPDLLTKLNLEEVVEIEQPKKQKKKKAKKVKKPVKKEGKHIAFDLNQNKTKEFYKHSKVSVGDLPRSKE